jgi:hypothetical protein
LGTKRIPTTCTVAPAGGAKTVGPSSAPQNGLAAQPAGANEMSYATSTVPGVSPRIVSALSAVKCAYAPAATTTTSPGLAAAIASRICGKPPGPTNSVVWASEASGEKRTATAQWNRIIRVTSESEPIAAR